VSLKKPKLPFASIPQHHILYRYISSCFDSFFGGIHKSVVSASLGKKDKIIL